MDTPFTYMKAESFAYKKLSFLEIRGQNSVGNSVMLFPLSKNFYKC